MIKKRKSLSLFQSDYIQLQSVVSSVTPWKYTVQSVWPKKKNSPYEGKRKGKRDGNKGKKSREVEKRRRRVERWKRGEEEKGMERVCAKGKEKGRMRCGRKEERKKEKNEGEGEREEWRGKERRLENR